MLGAYVHIGDTVDEKDANGIRFPVVVKDVVAESITASKMYVLPADLWGSAVAPTSEEIIQHEETLATDTTNAWGNYAENNTNYDDGYEETFVYMYNIPQEKYTTDFYVCSWMRLESGMEETTEVISRSMSDVATSAINAGEYTVEQLGKYLPKTSYRIKHYTRLVTGAYVLYKTTTSAEEAYVGLTPTITPDKIDGYTYNPALTAKVNALTTIENSNTAVACYYENDAYKFQSQPLVGVNYTTVTKEDVVGLDETERQMDVYKITRVNTGDYSHAFKYTSDNVGKYLVFRLYYEKATSIKIAIFDAAYTKTVPVVTLYDDKGKLQPSNQAQYFLDRWVNVVVYLDEQYFPKNKSSFRFSFANWSGDTTLYFGEYTFLTEEQYKANFEQKQPQ